MLYNRCTAIYKFGNILTFGA